MRRLGSVLAMSAALYACGGGDETAASPTTSSSSSGGSAGSGGSGGSDGGGGAGATGGGGAAPIAIGVRGDDFTIDGVPTFLLGVSYFDGRNWHVEDLDGLASRGFNLIRIWLDWDPASFFDAGGALAAQDVLVALTEACRSRGIVVDVTILDPSLTFADREAAVRATITALAAQPNVFFDLMNEHDHGGGPISHDEVAALAAAARERNPGAILTVSSTGGHIVDDLTLVPVNVDEELGLAGLDLLTPHLSRTADFADKTDQRVTVMKDYLASIGRPVPVYLQEEARRGHSGLDPTLEEFVQAATEARDAGAAAWVFHTDAGFDLAAGTFFAQLDPVEAAVVDALGAAVFGG
jgi:hypothetical protein